MNTLALDNKTRFELAKQSLEGLATGDAFGQRFFAPGNVGLIAKRQAPPPYWSYTDDTAMAISIVRNLDIHGEIHQDELARRFATVFAGEPNRGYGHGAIQLMEQIHRGDHWRDVALELFEGQGSMGNGGAMRVAPLGAYFADDLERVAEQARLSAEVTHAHPEGQAGAIAVAVAAALATQIGLKRSDMSPKQLFDMVVQWVPDGLLRTNLKQAAVLPEDAPLEDVVRIVGNGSRIIAFDTVPFCLWCAFYHWDSYADALWTCVAGGGDVDTTAAIVGGIVVLSAGLDSIPMEWQRAREQLPSMNGDKS